jgi:hypothetical protein
MSKRSRGCHFAEQVDNVPQECGSGYAGDGLLGASCSVEIPGTTGRLARIRRHEEAHA